MIAEVFCPSSVAHRVITAPLVVSRRASCLVPCRRRGSSPVAPYPLSSESLGAMGGITGEGENARESRGHSKVIASLAIARSHSKVIDIDAHRLPSSTVAPRFLSTTVNG